MTKKINIHSIINVALLGVFGFAILIFNSQNDISNFKKYACNGVVERIIRSNASKLVKFYSLEEYYDLRVNYDNIKKNDSISKPMESEYIQVFRKNDTEDYKLLYELKTY